MKTTSEEKKLNEKEYFKAANKSKINIRLNAQLRSILQSQMMKEGWNNITTYIKFKLFGLEPDEKLDAIIQEKDPATMALLLRNQLMELTNHYIYIRFRYDKDMQQLYKEEGVNIKEWIKATNKWHRTLVEKTSETFALLSRIAAQLQLDEFFVSESDDMKIDLDEATQEELDALAAQIQKENIALGRPNTFE